MARGFDNAVRKGRPSANGVRCATRLRSEGPVSDSQRLLKEASSHPVEGWDFGWLRERLSSTPLPWDFEAIVTEHARESPDLLDMGTGGGEWLASLAYRPPRTVATEGWAPNLDVAGARLRPLGITVVSVEGAPDNVEQIPNEERGRLPFPDESFALISNRHESFVAEEVARVLGQGGTFITQQTGGNYDDFYDALGLTRPSRRSRAWNLALAIEQVGAADLHVIASAESEQQMAFSDVGAFAWYLMAVPWAVPGFSIESHRRSLEQIHDRIGSGGPVIIRQPSFWLKAIKPASYQALG